jgi:hypothetical protein
MMSTKGIIGGVIIMMAFLMLIMSTKHKYTVYRTESKDLSLCKNEDGDRIKIPGGFYRGGNGKCFVIPPPPPPQQHPTANNQPIYSQPQQPPVKVKEKVTYKLDEKGCATIEIVGDYDFYPKGGEVVITPPNPGLPWHDSPGTSHPKGTTPFGKYTVCKTEHSDAWGVDVWN